MGNKNQNKNRRLRSLSPGSMFITAVVLFVFAGLLYVFPKLGSENVRLSVLLRENDIPKQDDTVIDGQYTDVQQTDVPAENEQTAMVPIIIPTPQPAQQSVDREVTICFGGTVAIEDKVRKSDYYNDTKVYDFSQNLSLLSSGTDSDLNVVFCENIFSDSHKVSKTVVPSSAAEMISYAGFDMALCGYRSCFDKGKNGLTDTLDSFAGAGLDTRGGYRSKPTAEDLIITVNGVRIAILQFTDKLEQTGTNQLRKSSSTECVSLADTETVQKQISAVRSAGAQVVIACVNWGRIGDTAPSSNQIKLSRMIAEAGADLIIGAGSRTVQKAEYIKCNAEDGSEKNVLCAYSVGTLLSDNRDRINRMSGMLLKVNFSVSGQASAVRDIAYVPTYIWYYKQDGQNYYRTVIAEGDAPDGMDQDQIKNRNKACELVDELWAGFP